VVESGGLWGPTYKPCMQYSPSTPGSPTCTTTLLHHTHTHTQTHTHAQAHTHAHTHKLTHTYAAGRVPAEPGGAGSWGAPEGGHRVCHKADGRWHVGRAGGKGVEFDQRGGACWPCLLCSQLSALQSSLMHRVVVQGAEDGPCGCAAPAQVLTSSRLE